MAAPDLRRPDYAVLEPEVILDYTNHVPALIAFLSNRLTSNASQAFRRVFGIGLTDWRVLIFVASQPHASGHMIAQVMGIDSGAVSRSLGSLEAQGLICATAIHGRGKKRAITLSEAGAALYKKAVEVSRERETRLLSRITAAERRQLVRLLGKLSDSMDDVEAFTASL